MKMKATGGEKSTFDCDVQETSREVLLEENIQNLTVKEFWDSHGTLTDWGKVTKYKNVKVRLERVTRHYAMEYADFDSTCDELFIDDKRYEALDIQKLSGTTFRATAKAIIGCG